jgi:uncharacterized membrane-anchored protein
MDSSFGSALEGAMAKVLGLLAVLMFFVPFGIWKVVELSMWALSHISIHIK